MKGNNNSYDFGSRIYDPRIGRWLSVDPVLKAHESTYSSFANNPIWIVDPNGKDSVLFFDQATNPGNKRVYTAKIYVVKDDEIFGPYEGSTYPNYPDSKNSQNTLNEGWYDYNNASGHHGGQEKGLNLLNEMGSRYNLPGTDPQGKDVKVGLINVHSGQNPNNNGGKENRGSAGCQTIKPSDADAFFNNFTWTNTSQTTGTSTGRAGIFRGSSGDNLKNSIEVKQALQNPTTDGQKTQIETNDQTNSAYSNW